MAALAEVVGVGVHHQRTANDRVLASQRNELVLKQQEEKQNQYLFSFKKSISITKLQFREPETELLFEHANFRKIMQA